MNIVITGTSSGIGFELVKSFYKESNNNIIAISRNRHKLEKLLNECKNINSSSSLYILDKDITNFNIDWLNEIGKHLNSIDILVNNAGLLINKNLKI
jgi:short-subunit dehydrogenase